MTWASLARRRLVFYMFCFWPDHKKRGMNSITAGTLAAPQCHSDLQTRALSLAELICLRTNFNLKFLAGA